MLLVFKTNKLCATSCSPPCQVYAITLVGGRHVTLPVFAPLPALLAIGAAALPVLCARAQCACTVLAVGAVRACLRVVCMYMCMCTHTSNDMGWS